LTIRPLTNWYSFRDSEGEISLDAKIPADERFEYLAKCVLYGWRYTAGSPKDPEGWSELMAIAARSLIQDLTAQGGEAALMAMTEQTNRTAAKQKKRRGGE